jgi:4-hydroxy-tetrahydrodipicolinate synthase
MSAGDQMLHLKGAITALVTPFRPDGEVDMDAFRALVEWQIRESIDGLVISGTTGESATLTHDEKLALFRAALEQSKGRVPIIAGTGSNNTRESVALTREALALGVDASLAVVPYYNKPSQEGLLAHFAELNSVGLPLVLYNVPGRTVVSMTAETLGKLARLPHVVGLKEASANLALDSEMMAAVAEPMERGFSMLSGDDFTTLPFMALGGHGCISVVSNLAPRLVHDLCALTAAGELHAARPLHHKVHRLSTACFRDASPGPTKWILGRMERCAPTLRLPLVQPSNKLRAELDEIARKEGLVG